MGLLYGLLRGILGVQTTAHVKDLALSESCAGYLGISS